MRAAFVNHLAYAVGSNCRTVEETVAAGATVSPAPALLDSGFRRHHVCSQGETAYTLASAAVHQIGEKLQNVDAIIYATCIPLNGNAGDVEKFDETRDVKYLMDYPAGRLQSEFRLHNAAVFGLNQQACTSMLGSIRLATMMIASDCDISRVLCVTADRFPEGAHYEQAYNLISDGAAACVVSDEPHGYRVLAAHAITNGAMSFASDDETAGSFFSYSHAVITRTLKKAGLTIDDIDWVVPQNTNAKAWMVLSSLLKFNFTRVYFPTIGETAHVISGDNIINLKHLADSGQVKAGQRLMLFMAGYGLNWQCLLLEKY